jgi:hypothetical protein
MTAYFKYLIYLQAITQISDEGAVNWKMKEIHPGSFEEKFNKGIHVIVRKTE